MNGAMPKQEPVRHDFSKIRSYMALPNLIDVQRKSYERFLQMNLLPEEREDTGLQSVFTSVFPFSDFRSEERRVGKDRRSTRRHTRLQGDWSSDVCSSDLTVPCPNRNRFVTTSRRFGATWLCRISSTSRESPTNVSSR